jgi:hypothetical protein
MRTIERQMVMAISRQNNWRKDNTSVEVIEHGTRFTPSYEKEIVVKLHGNTIARIFPARHRMTISSCGWKTATTKSRLNAILHLFYHNGGVYQKDYEWYIGDKEFTDNMEVSY